jgi:ferrochelatase
MANPESFFHEAADRTGILVTNLGTPDAPTAPALRRYLAEFLWDPRVVETSRPLWWLILHGVILRVRPARAAKAYQKVWTEEGSPLLAISRKQAELLQDSLRQQIPGPVEVALGMRYGSPSIRQALESLRERGARRILALPLYPQYSATTTASTLDAIGEVFRAWRGVPDFHFVSHYHDHPAYIAALAASIREFRTQHGNDVHLLFSFHGIPERYFRAGDPYHCECQKTARLVAELLGLDETQWDVSFQSRFGREEWLKPYTDHTLEKWAREGRLAAQVICPGFSADCLETLEEIDEQNREIFLSAGGERFDYIPALNDRPDHIRALTDIVLQHLRGWPEVGSTRDADTARAERAARLARVQALEERLTRA